MTDLLLPDLTDSEPTRATLHAYARAMAVLPRAHLEAHPKWWHVSLAVLENGLATGQIPIPHGGSFTLRMDLAEHVVVLEGDTAGELSMTKGLTGTEMGEELIELASRLGLEGDYQRDKFENDQPRVYHPEEAWRLFEVLRYVNETFEEHRSRLEGEMGPVQLWPHGFDLAFEWFGTRVETHEGIDYPSQLNLGFALDRRPYFYSNPWPFDRDVLLGEPLPSGASWFTDSWEGTILYYEQLVGDPDARSKLLAYAEAVHELAAPTLTA